MGAVAVRNQIQTVHKHKFVFGTAVIVPLTEPAHGAGGGAKEHLARLCRFTQIFVHMVPPPHFRHKPQIAAGHMDGTSLPVGGRGTHCVIAAHRGLPSARLFTDLDRLEPGDTFYLHILNQVLAYRVDQILPMVAKDDYAALNEALKIIPGEDHVTLFTCTPYGINSHRLLVRGLRTEYRGEEAPAQEMPAQSMARFVPAEEASHLLILSAWSLTAVLIAGVPRPKRRKRP